MKLNGYDNLAQTGVSWVPQLPAHWTLVRFRHLFEFGRGLGITKSNLKEEGIPCVNYGEIHSTLGFEVIPEIHTLKCVEDLYLDEGKASLLKCGDFVFADTSEDLDGSGNFTYLNSNVPTFAGYHTVIARLQTDDLSRYLAYLFDSELFRFQIRKSVTGVKVYSITQAILKSGYVWLPPKEEQLKICQFLDVQTKKIDDLVAKKRTILGKLEEQRSAIINQAIIRGIDSEAPMAPSSSSWLDEVPAHWREVRLRFMVQLNPLKSSLNGTAVDTMVSFVPMDAIGEYGGIRLDSTKPLCDVYGGYTYFADDDVVVAKITPCFENGKGALASKLSNGIAFGTTELHVLRAGEEVDSRWLFYLTSSHAFRAIGESEMYGAGGQKRVPESFIKNFKLGIPPKAEQIEIANYIDEKLSRLDKMVELNQSAIAKLMEYRSAIVSSVVTGHANVVNTQLPAV